MGYLVAMDTCVTLFWLVRFCMIHSMWRNNGTSCIVGARIVLIGISVRNSLKSTRNLYDFKSCGSNSGFHDLGDIDLDFWPMFYFMSHALGMKYWNLHARFHKNRLNINGWYALDKHTNTHTLCALAIHSSPILCACFCQISRMYTIIWPRM